MANEFLVFRLPEPWATGERNRIAWGLIGGVPRIRLMKELGRSIRLDEEAERKLLAYARQPLRDVIILMRDTGMRNRKELFRMRIENLDWNTRTISFQIARPPPEGGTFL
jgi:integrase